MYYIDNGHKSVTCNNIENFDNKTIDILKPTLPNIYDVLTEKCDQKYCNVNLWQPNYKNKVILNDDEVLSNYRSDGKCCIIKKDIMNFINNRGNNA